MRPRRTRRTRLTAASLRKLGRSIVLASFLLCLAALVLRVRSRDTKDVFMLAGPGGRCLIVTSHVSHWFEFDWFHDGWTDRGVGWWSDDRRTHRLIDPTPVPGPVAIEHGAFQHTNWRPPYAAGEWTIRRGRLAVMCDPNTGRPYYGAYELLPATQGMWDIGADSPYWLLLHTTRVRIPNGAVIAVTVLLPSVFVIGWLWRLPARIRSNRAARLGLCSGCGYDLIPSPKPVIAILPDEPQLRQPTPRP